MNSHQTARCLAARGASAAAFAGRCIRAGGVAPPSNTFGILGCRALPSRRLAHLGATRHLHHGLLASTRAAGRRSAAMADGRSSISWTRRSANIWQPRSSIRRESSSTRQSDRHAANHGQDGSRSEPSNSATARRRADAREPDGHSREGRRRAGGSRGTQPSRRETAGTAR